MKWKQLGLTSIINLFVGIFLLLVLACNSRKVEYSSDANVCVWFGVPPSAERVFYNSERELNIVRQLDKKKPLVVHFNDTIKSESIFRVLHELSLHRIHVYLELESGSVIHYGFPLTDFHTKHSWYKLLDERTDSETTGKNKVHTLCVSSDHYTLDGKKESYDEITDTIHGWVEENNEKCLLIVLERNIKYGKLDGVLQILHNNKILRYVIQLEE